MLCQLKSCRKCQGDLILDEDEWRCWQCGQHYYPTLPSPGSLPEPPPSNPQSDPGQWPEQSVRRGSRYSRRSIRNINSMIVAKDRSDERWWVRNADIIRYLDEGRTVREITLLVGRGERQVRVIRERLNDLRASTETDRSAA